MIRGADRILVLSGNRIEEEGDHGELMAKEGIYYHLYMSAKWIFRGSGRVIGGNLNENCSCDRQQQRYYTSAGEGTWNYGSSDAIYGLTEMNF